MRPRLDPPSKLDGHGGRSVPIGWNDHDSRGLMLGGEMFYETPRPKVERRLKLVGLVVFGLMSAVAMVVLYLLVVDLGAVFSFSFG